MRFTTFFINIIKNLDHLDWTDLEGAQNGVENILRRLGSNLPLLEKELTLHSLSNQSYIPSHSFETTTHFKWYVFDNPEPGYKIHFHEYKNKDRRIEGYAEVPHNHRYWLSSLILNGGFKQNIFTVEGREEKERNFQMINVRDEKIYTRGDVYTVSPQVIHSLSEIEDQTSTLIIRSRAVNPFSEEYIENTKAIRRHYPISARVKFGYPIRGWDASNEWG